MAVYERDGILADINVSVFAVNVAIFVETCFQAQKLSRFDTTITVLINWNSTFKK